MISKRIEPGDMVRITNGIGAGQTVKVQSLEELPMGTGVNVVLAGDYPETLNPANVEVVPHPIEAENARLRAQVKRLSRAIRHDMERSLRTRYIRDDMSLQAPHEKRMIRSYIENRDLSLSDVGLAPLEDA